MVTFFIFVTSTRSSLRLRHVCLRSEEAGEKTDSVAEKIIVERADLGRRIKFSYPERPEVAGARLSDVACVIILGSRQMQRAPLMSARVFKSTITTYIVERRR